MKMFLISDNIDTQVGLRLAGVKGVVVHQRQEVLQAMKKVVADQDISILIMTEKLIRLVQEEWQEMKLESRLPLLVEIPDRHGSIQDSDSITRNIREAIGLKI